MSIMQTTMPRKPGGFDKAEMISVVSNAYSSIAIVEFAQYDLFLQNPDVKLHSKLAMTKNLPGFAFLQQYAPDPISITNTSLDYYKMGGITIGQLDDQIMADVATIQDNADSIDALYRTVSDYGISQYLLQQGVSDSGDLYLQFAAQIAALLKQVVIHGASLFSGIIAEVVTEEDRRTRETQWQQEHRAELEDEEERERLNEEIEAIEQFWADKTEGSLAQVEATFDAVYAELEKQKQEHIDLLVRKHSDLMSRDALVIDEEFKLLEHRCEVEYLQRSATKKKQLAAIVDRLKAQTESAMQELRTYVNV